MCKRSRCYARTPPGWCWPGPPRWPWRVLREIDPEVEVVVAVPAGSDQIECLRVPTGHKVRPTWRRQATAEAAYEAWLPVEFNSAPGAGR